jgi:hypothetical protein
MKTAKILLLALVIQSIALVNVFGLGISEMKKDIKDLEDQVEKIKKSLEEERIQNSLTEADVQRMIDSALAQNRAREDINPQQSRSQTAPAPTPGAATPQRQTTQIEGTGSLSKNVIVDYILQMSKNSKTPPERDFVDKIVGQYISEAAREGINHDIAIAQMCYATQNLTNRQRLASFNFAGLDTSRGISYYGDGSGYKTWEDGVKAHIEHLKGYASSTPPNQPVVNRRYEILKEKEIIGTIKTLDALCVTWAPQNKDYGNSIAEILRELYRNQSTILIN